MTDQQGIPTDEPIIELWALGYEGFIGLIVQGKTGVWYTNQTAGVGCRHPAIEGFYVPLSPCAWKTDSLENYGATWDEGYDSERVKAWLAERNLDELFEPAPDAGIGLQEAWIAVRVRKVPDHSLQMFAPDSLLGAIAGRIGVLTYQNSD